MTRYSLIKEHLLENTYTWLITGVAGFIGSNILETLLSLNQRVVGVDNFITGKRINLDHVSFSVQDNQWKNFSFIKGDLADPRKCNEVIKNIDFVLHQAALGSVPRSIKDPLATNQSNVEAFLNILNASKNFGVKSFTFASSSSVYGDHNDLPKYEDRIGSQLSPYAVSKYTNELYADVFARSFNFNSIGLRYFNVFGKRQDPYGPYAAVIPKWISSFINGEDIYIYGDGSTSRDFCFIDNVVQINILSALAENDAKGQIYNVANGNQTSLLDLFDMLKFFLAENGVEASQEPIFKDFRPGDVKHSLASIDKAKLLLGFEPSHTITTGLKETMSWYINFLRK